MSLKNSFILFSFLFIGTLMSNNNVPVIFYSTTTDILICDTLVETQQLTGLSSSQEMRPNPLIQLFRIKNKKNKRAVAAILAFPLPFGIVALHRIYLGCAPYVPVVYIGSIGGVFGILPFIDFCVLLMDKDIDRYNNNKKVFMWVD